MVKTNLVCHLSATLSCLSFSSSICEQVVVIPSCEEALLFVLWASCGGNAFRKKEGGWRYIFPSFLNLFFNFPPINPALIGARPRTFTSKDVVGVRHLKPPKFEHIFVARPRNICEHTSCNHHNSGMLHVKK